MDRWPLVGREPEMRVLRDLVKQASSPGLVIAAPAGVGKTRLALEGLALAEGAGLATARATGTQAATGIPFGAVAHLLPPAEQADKAGTDHTDLLRRSVAALKDLATPHRLLLLVDDAHLLDDASATLVHQVALTRSGFVLATVRTGEPAPDPIVGLWKDGLVERLELDGLQARSIEELLAATLGGPVDPVAVAALAARCQGNVLYLRELVLGASQDGTLRDAGGIWRLTGPLAPSARLVELIDARFVRLTPDERSLLELIAIGQPLGAAELADAEPALVEGLEAKGLIASRLDGRRLEVRLAHPLYGDVLRAQIPPFRIRRIARQLAEMIEATGARRREDTLRVATWRLTGGGGGPELMLAAATTARWRFDFPLAERLARAAIDAGADFDAALLAAQVVSLQGHSAEAETEFATLATAAETDAQRVNVAVSRLRNQHLALHGDQFLRILEDTEAAVTDQAARDEIAARRAVLVLAYEGPAAGAELALPLLERGEGGLLAMAAHARSYGLGRLGQVEQAVAATHRGHAAHLAATSAIEWYPFMHLWFRCEALARAGQFHEAGALAEAQYQQAVAERSPEAQAWFALHLAGTAGDRGQVRTSAHLAQEAMALFRQLGQPFLSRLCLESLALAQALGGQAEEAAATLVADEELGPPWKLNVDGLQAKAWTAVAAGDYPRARRLFEEAAETGETIGDLVGAAAAWHGLARIGRSKEVVDRLERLAARLSGDLGPARAAHALALAHVRAAPLEEVSLRFEAMGADLLAAEAAADAAVAWRRIGDPKKAAAAQRRAALLVDRCEGAATPALQAIDARARLSPAERVTAVLAAAGRSNKDIAAELYVSVRTVETRLQNVYGKLGVSGRTELASALGTSGENRPGPTP